MKQVLFIGAAIASPIIGILLAVFIFARPLAMWLFEEFKEWLFPELTTPEEEL